MCHCVCVCVRACTTTCLFRAVQNIFNRVHDAYVRNEITKEQCEMLSELIRVRCMCMPLSVFVCVVHWNSALSPCLGRFVRMW